MLKNKFLSVEDILMKIKNQNRLKLWRNCSILLICLIFTFAIKSFSIPLQQKKDLKNDYIAEVNIDGIILDDSFRDAKLLTLIDQINIKAIILNIDSPGGVVTPSEILYDIFKRINQKKPVVVVMNSMATSGAYMIALASDYLIARNTTLTGSIGVLLQSYNIVDLANKVGVELKTFKSSELKGMPSLFEKNTEYSNKIMQTSLNDINEYFKEIVATRKKITPENFLIATNGQAFTGRQALKIGLIDEIGNKETALKYLKTRNVNTKLPIIKINIKKKQSISILEKITGMISFNLNTKSNTNNKVLSILKFE